jgi:hypothetical protein
MRALLSEKKLSTAFLRITLTRVTAVFFLFSLLHCFAQGILQAFLYTLDSQYDNLVTNILQTAHVPNGDLAWITNTREGYKLRLCYDIPLVVSPLPCVTIFESGQGDFPIPSGYRRTIDDTRILPRSTIGQIESIGATFDDSGEIDGVNITIGGGGSSFFLNKQCTRVLLYADQALKNSKREDFALISVQFWLFAISFFAIMYDSVPHTLGGLYARVLVTGWSAYTIWRTLHIEDTFFHLITGPDSPCHADLFPTYFKSRTGLEIADLILNCTALFLSAYLSRRLLKTYKALSFKHLGAPPNILRIYKYFMGVLVCLQLSVFLLVTAMGLWVSGLS